MSYALHAEWTKLRTVAGTGWLLAAAVVVTVALSLVVALAVTRSSVGAGEDLTKLSLIGVQLGQAVIVILAVGTIAGEYGTGMIQVTLTAMPRRVGVLGAKALVLTGLVVVAGVIAVLGCLLAGRLAFAAGGFTPAHGYRPLSLADGPTLRAAAGSVLYLGLIGLMSLGVATLVRESATAVGVMLGLLYVFPIVAHLVANPHLERLLERLGPMTAGLAIQSTVGVSKLPIGPWPGLGVLAGWAAVALFCGGLALRLRDA